MCQLEFAPRQYWTAFGDKIEIDAINYIWQLMESKNCYGRIIFFAEERRICLLKIDHDFRQSCRIGNLIWIIWIDIIKLFYLLQSSIELINQWTKDWEFDIVPRKINNLSSVSDVKEILT